MSQGRCIIITAYLPGGVAGLFRPAPGDFLLCADGGYRLACQAGLTPDAFIGDFDSLEESQIDCPDCIRVPVEKDDTDTLLCLKHGLELGYGDFVILGGLGGRLDHTVANLQTLAFAQQAGAKARILDWENQAFLLAPGEHHIPAKKGYKFSIFAWTQECTGVYERNLQYPLTDATLTQHFPLGVSNVFMGDEAVVCLGTGLLLCVLSKY